MVKKGITNFEFVLAVFVFLSTISFVAVSIINEVPALHDKSVEDIAKSKTYYISQMLIFDKGFPETWTNETVERPGLSTGTPYILSPSKITNFQNLCADTQKLRNLIGDIEINITKQDGTPVLFCKTSNLPIQLKIKRSAVLSGEVVKIEVVSS